MKQRLRAFFLSSVHFLSDPVRFFVTVGLVLGLFFVFATPPIQVPDEEGHFYKSYALSEGNLLQKNTTDTLSGASIPKALNDFSKIALDESLTLRKGKYTPALSSQLGKIQIGSERIDVSFVNLATYSPVAYVPQAIGVGLSKLVTNNVLVIFYAGRIANLLFLLGISALALGLLTRGRWLMTMLLLSPMTMFLAGSFSADPSAIAYTALLASLVVYVITKKPVGRWSYVLLGLTATGLSLSKQAYIVFVPLVLLILVDWNRTKKFFKLVIRKDRILPVLAIFAIVGICFAGWQVINSGVNSNASVMLQSVGVTIDSNAQKAVLLENPLHFAKMLFLTTFTGFSDGNFYALFGCFGWLNVPMPLWSIILYIVVLVLAIGHNNPPLKEGRSKLQQPWYLTVAGVLGLACYVGIATGLFILWTPTGATYIEGIQGRYFIPILLLIAPGVAGAYRHNIRLRYCVMLLGVVQILAIYTVIGRYYLAI